jgi:hypothetical protein
MKKKSKMTYADKAKAIMSRYKKRLGENFERYDKMASDALNRELSQLMEQQELAKQKQTEQQFQQMAYGGGLPVYRLPGVADFSDTDIKPFPSRMQQVGFATPTIPNYIGKITQPQVTQPKASPTPKPNTWWSNLPIESRIGMISQLAGNLGQGILAATAGRPKQMTYNPITLEKPETISADEQLAEARRGYRGAMTNLRYLSPSQYMAAMSDLATRSAAANAGIIQSVDNQNAEIFNRQRALEAENAFRNEERRIEIDQYNEAARQAYLGNIGNMIGGMSGTIAGGMRDVLGYKQAERNLPYTGTSNVSAIRDDNGEYLNVTWVDGRRELGTATRGTKRVYIVDGKEVEKPIFDTEYDKRIKR